MDIALPIVDAAHALTSWGYLTVNEGYAAVHAATGSEARSVKGAANVDHMRRAVAEFQQRWHKYDLDSTGELDDQTAALMSRRFCDCPDFEEVTSRATGLRRWNANRINWGGDVRVGDISWTEAQTFTRDRTLEVCGLLIEINGVGRTNIRSAHGYIDGPGGTLAQAYLPGRPSDAARETLGQEYDTGERGRLSQHAFNMVCLHETGHSVGMSHDSSSAIAVMDPYLNEDLDKWQPADISELQARYGRPGTPTDPPVDPPVAPPPEEPDAPCPPWFRRELMAAVKQGIRQWPNTRS